MRLPPIDVYLSWPSPNYKDPVTRGHALVAVNSVFCSLAVITVALRLYTRIVIKRWFGLDDIFIVLALFFTIGLTAVVLLANQHYGWDRHVYDIPLNMLVPTAKVAMVAKVVFTAAATFTRLSLHCFYYRLVSDTGKRWFKWLIHFNVAYTIGIFISFTFVAIFLCNPVSNYWMIGAPADSCLNEGTVTFIVGIINCVADLLTTITPMPLVVGLHMPRRQRLAVAVLFGLGIIVTVAGVVRTVYIWRAFYNEYDQTWYSYPLWIAAAVEIDLGVICASAPVLRPLLAKIPISLSDTVSRAFSTSKKSGCGTNPSNAPTLQISSTPAGSAGSSKRRSEAIGGVPELSRDKGKSYELQSWPEAGTELQDVNLDVERGTIQTRVEREDKPKVGGFKRFWRKMFDTRSESSMNSQMTITRTEEIDMRIDTASRRTSRMPTTPIRRETSINDHSLSPPPRRL